MKCYVTSPTYLSTSMIFLVGSRSLEEHKQHLREVFTRLRENCLTVNFKKCVLAKSTVTFLGHTMDSKAIRPLPEKVDAINQFPLPSSKLDVQNCSAW